MLADRSRSGTYVDGARVTTVPLEGLHTFHLGAPDGPELTVLVAPPTMPPPPPPPAPFDPSRTAALDDRALRLSSGERKLVVPPGQMVTIGRDPGCDLTIDSQIVSRQHTRLFHDGRGWVIQDLGSTRGSFVDGRRLTSPYRAQGVFEMLLGDEDAGERIQVVTAGVHRAPRRRLLPILVACSAVLVAFAMLAVLGLVADDEGDEEPSAAEQLAGVKASTVLIGAADNEGEILWTGSGAVITDEGHILTNAHVADPGAESLDALEELLEGLEDETEPDHFVIMVSPGEDQPVKPRYIAEWVGSSDDQDASIIQITSDYETGAPVEQVPLEPVAIGSSSELRAGSAIQSLGYPDNSTTLSISVVHGEVISFVSAEEFHELVGGDAREVMNTSAVLGEGSSGGPVVHDGEIVGINFTRSYESLDRGWVVPIDEIRDLLATVGV